MASAKASVIFTYDFPGNPGTGVAANQTNNTQPANATFGNFTRSGVQQTNVTSNVFESGGISISNTFDGSTYVGFTITATASYHLDLSQIMFDVDRSAGTGSGEVQLLLNGSATPYATFAFTPTTTLTTNTFNFGPLSAVQNATTLEVRFYLWNSTGAGERFWFDNVVTSGTISNVPEPSTWFCISLPIVAIASRAIRGKRRG